MADRVGVLLMAYGTPASAAEVEPYYTHIRRGRPPTPEQLADLQRRYDAIGGISPLAARTRAQAAGLSSALGGDVPVVLGMKHAAPFIEDAVAHLYGLGVTRAVALTLAPHYSALSVGEYVERAVEAAGDKVTVLPVTSWHLAPGFVALLAERVRAALDGMPDDSEVVFTAHSLPERILATGDPYPAQLAETAAAVAAAAGAARWSTGWQSAGRTPEPWLGPDILDVVRTKAAAGVPGLVVCPAGFVSDHLEVLYDLDIDAARVAAEAGIAFARTSSLNDDPRFCAALADVVRARLADSEENQ